MPSTSTRRPAILTGFADEGMAAFAGYPLLLDSKLVGVMALYARHEFSPSARDAMAVVADGIALGIERKRAERELERVHVGSRDGTPNGAAERRAAEQAGRSVTRDPAAGRSWRTSRVPPWRRLGGDEFTVLLEGHRRHERRDPGGGTAAIGAVEETLRRGGTSGVRSATLGITVSTTG